MDKSKESKCSFCQSIGKYKCSRCHVKYCSIDCFKSVSHNQCSEQFFKQCVLQELKSQRFDESSKKKIIEILKRNSNYCEAMQLNENEFNDTNTNDDSIDDESEEHSLSLDDRFSDLDINSSQVCDLWSKLSDSEQREFNSLLESGEIGQFVSVWNPWWRQMNRQSLITPLDECSESQNPKSEEISTTESVKIPDLWPNIVKLNELTSKSPSPSICPAVINTIYSYCYICRLFNGDYESIESIEAFIETCPQLSHNIICNDLSKSLQMSIQQIMTKQPSEFAIQLLSDLRCILEGPKLIAENIEAPDYALRALSDSIFTINKVKKRCSKQKRKALKLDLIVKKLEFYLSWSVTNGLSLVNSLKEIDSLIDSMLLIDGTPSVNQSDEDFQLNLHQKPLIEEIT